MNSLDLKTSSYDYYLPKELIATTPAKPADSARLLVYNRATKEITHTTFREILNYIPKGTAIFLNDTKVIKARIFGKKSSGGKIELLVIKPMPNREFIAMIKGKVKVGTILEFKKGLIAKVEALNSDGSRVVSFYLDTIKSHSKPHSHSEQVLESKQELKGFGNLQDNLDSKKIDFLALIEVLEKIGHIPLPPYINREDRKEDELDYQTLFSREAGSVAAPTASLHFTPELLDKMQKEFETYMLTLHVGAGTFKPVEVEEITKHPMHSEVYNIPKNAQEVIKSSFKILAVGTTTTRTIEYFARKNKESGECDLFLHPHNKPIRVDYLLTNFHLPKSTLIMLVSAFLGRDKTLKLYNEAIKMGYRFYSYGDAMLII